MEDIWYDGGDGSARLSVGSVCGGGSGRLQGCAKERQSVRASCLFGSAAAAAAAAAALTLRMGRDTVQYCPPRD